MVGAHLDSVTAGPGIQDNGSGSAAILEIAIQLAEFDEDDDSDELLNRVRFAWWGAEELGLLGSTFHVANASQEELDEIAMNLNFDMIGSPNFVRFIYDGDGSDTPAAGPPGSEHIEQMFINYFVEQGLPVEPTAFDGRSDYGPFIAAGIDAFTQCRFDRLDHVDPGKGAVATLQTLGVEVDGANPHRLHLHLGLPFVDVSVAFL